MNNFLVTAVSEIDKKKWKIRLEDGEVFALYKGEARKMGIEEGKNISLAQYEQIQTLLYKRGKDRALYLLKDSAKTTQDIRQKLKQGYYPVQIIEQIIEFLNCYHYLDDSSYVQNYYEMWKEKRSRKQIQYALLKKGIELWQINEILDERNDEDENHALLCQLDKKMKGKVITNPKEKQKIVQYLMGKGFSYADIAQELEKRTHE